MGIYTTYRAGPGHSAFPLQQLQQQQEEEKVEMRAATSTARYYNPVNVTKQAQSPGNRAAGPEREQWTGGPGPRTTSPSIDKPAKKEKKKKTK